MNEKLLLYKALDGIAWELASSNMGMFPQAVEGGSKPYKKRTERMEGHNDCVMEFHDKYFKFVEWLHDIPEEHEELVYSLLIEDKMEVYGEKGSVKMAVDCSDTFFWGCSDCEEISLEELPSLVECYAASPTYGGELWCAKKRGMRPQSASYKECYPEIEWPLFDACGPERTDSDGNGDRAKVTKVEPILNKESLPNNKTTETGGIIRNILAIILIPVTWAWQEISGGH